MNKNGFDEIAKLIDSWNFSVTKMFMSQVDWNYVYNIKYYYICY